MYDFHDILMFLGSTVCHQLPERSYFYDGVQMPLCARCIGIHFGFILSVSFLLLGSTRYSSKLPSMKQLVVLGSIMAFYFVDAGLSYSGISTSDNLRRTLSGLAIGVPLPFVVVPLLNLALHREGSKSSVFDKPSDWIWFAGLYGAGALLILSAESIGPLFYLVSVVGVIGVFVFFTVILSVIVGLVFENRPLGSSMKVLVGASLAFVILMILQFLHSHLFPTT
jgi:uncharacterized membrane protein